MTAALNRFAMVRERSAVPGLALAEVVVSFADARRAGGARDESVHEDDDARRGRARHRFDQGDPVLRGIGWFLMTLGLTLIVRPIAVVASIVPARGSPRPSPSWFARAARG